MLDGLIGSLADLNKLIADAAFKDSTINGMINRHRQGTGRCEDQRLHQPDRLLAQTWH